MSGVLVGQFNLFLLFWVLTFVVYKYVFKNHLAKKGGTLYPAIYRRLKVVHPVFAVTMIVTGIYHGYLMLGGLRFHTGSLIILALMGMVGTFLLKKTARFRTTWKVYHKIGAVLVLGAVLIHLNFPGLI